MKNLIFFLACFLFPILSNGQENNYFEASLYSVGEKFYPRLIIEDQNSFPPNSVIGLWAIVECSELPYIPPSWKEKGYNPDNILNLDLKVGITYDYIYGKFIVGAGCSGNKKYFGPLIGLDFIRERWFFQALGLYSMNSAFKSHYSKEYIDQYQSWDKPIYIRGFDPNSWYKVKLLYSISHDIDIGVVSERFYGTCLASEYKFNKLIKFKFMFGRDMEFSKNMFSFGLLFNMK